MGDEHVRGAGSLSRKAGVIRRTTATRPLTCKATRPHCHPTATRIPDVTASAVALKTSLTANAQLGGLSRLDAERAAAVATHVGPCALGGVLTGEGLPDGCGSVSLAVAPGHKSPSRSPQREHQVVRVTEQDAPPSRSTSASSRSMGSPPFRASPRTCLASSTSWLHGITWRRHEASIYATSNPCVCTDGGRHPHILTPTPVQWSQLPQRSSLLDSSDNRVDDLVDSRPAR